jgi:phytanoyl-CoA hydroxylase
MSVINYYINGFVVIKNVFPAKDIDKILQDLEKTKKLVSKTKDKKFFHETKDGKINTIHNVQEFYKENKIKILIKKKKLSKCLVGILGNYYKIRNIEFFLKPKKTGMPSPFHQDNFYWNIEDAQALNVWVALTKSNRKNGGLCYLKNSQALGTIKHQVSFAKGSSHKIPDRILNKLKFKRIFPVLDKGDCLIHHPEVIHGSFSNKSSFDRTGVVVSFLKKNAKVNLKKMNKYKKNVRKSLNKLYYN